MNRLKYVGSFLIMFSIVLTMGCKDDDDAAPSVLELQKIALRNGDVSWQVSSVTKDSYDVTGQFVGFTLTIGDNTYNTVNGLASAWPASGTWEFQDADPNKILRDGTTPIALQLTGNELILSFTATGVSGGRVSGLDGEYVFVMVSE